MTENRLAFLSDARGIGGTLKCAPEDFIVEEIAPDGTILELDKKIQRPETPGRFVRFVLQKRNWSTPYAIKEIAGRLHISQKRMGFAGSKDKCAVTTQLASAEGTSAESVLGVRIRDISINGAWPSDDKVRLGSLLGNRFSIRARGAGEGAAESVKAILEGLAGKFPNYFGEQRFGTLSRNTHIVGERIVRGDFNGAAIAFLCEHPDQERNEEARSARKELLLTRDFRAALGYFPKHLKFERTMLSHLSEKPDDFIGAFRKLPRQTMLLFVHAFQSHLFNRLLSDRIRQGGGRVEMEDGEYLCPVDGFGFPVLEKMDVDGWLCMKIIGYNSNPNERERALLEEVGIRKEDFKIPKIPEVGSKGTFRTVFAPLLNFSFEESACTFRFSLQSGSYATMVLREFMEIDKKG